jgi:hypothetical protein
MGNSHDRRVSRRTQQSATIETHDPATTEKVSSSKVLNHTIDKKSLKMLWLSVCWGGGGAVVITLIAGAGAINRWAVIALVILGSLFFPVAVYLHGWMKVRVKAIGILVVIWGSMAAVGWLVRPQQRVVSIEMKISPSGFPISIPAHSTTSILRINPNRLLDATGDYLLKLDNTRGAEVTWPSQEEIDSKKSEDYETVFRMQVINHSLETLVSGKLLFHVSYNNGTLTGCMPPKNTPNYQNDFVLVPSLDPGKSFEFYAVNETSMCAWLIPPDKIAIKMIGDEKEKQVPLAFNSDPLYASGAPLFPPTKIAWYALPVKPNSYQISRKEY